MTPTPEAQCAANVRAWLSKHGLGSQREFRLVECDRAWLPRDAGLETLLSRMCAEGILEKRYAGNHGPNIVVGYRECVSRCAAQVIVHDSGIEIDFDSYQPGRRRRNRAPR